MIVPLSALLISCSLNAASLKNKYPVCTSADAFDRLQTIAQHQDEGAFKKIMGTECFYPKEGMPVEKIESRGWTTGIAQVKIYADGKLYDLWTNSESLSNKK